MNAQSLFKLRQTLKEKDWSMLHIQNGLFKAAVRGKFEGSDLQKLSELPVGNCFMIYTDVPDSRRPSLLSDLQKCIQGKQQVDLMGGLFDGMLLTNEKAEFVSKMPSLEAHRQMLLGLLQAPAQNLVEMLGRSQSTLVASLNQHIETMKETK